MDVLWWSVTTAFINNSQRAATRGFALQLRCSKDGTFGTHIIDHFETHDFSSFQTYVARTWDGLMRQGDGKVVLVGYSETNADLRPLETMTARKTPVLEAMVLSRLL